jgi:hypothetical protein
MLFEVKKQLEHGTKNPIVARLTLQTLELLKESSLPKEKTDKIGEIYISSLVKELLRCWEIKERLEIERAKAHASYKPPGRNEPAAHVPQIPRLEEECRNFLYEAKNFLRDLVTVFNLVHGTRFKEEASNWVSADGEPGPLMKHIVNTYGPNHVNTRYINQLPKCIAPYIAMRNAVEHPKGYSGELKIENISLGADGKLVDARWRRDKEGKIEYGPLDIIQELGVGVHNLLVLSEDILVMALQTKLAMPDATLIAVIPESARNPECAIKYRIEPNARLMAGVATAHQASQR